MVGPRDASCSAIACLAVVFACWGDGEQNASEPPPAGSLASVLDQIAPLDGGVFEEGEQESLLDEAFALVELGANPNERSESGTTLLFEAVVNGIDVERIGGLLEAGADPNATVHQGMTPLMRAVGWIPVADTYVELLVGHGADVRLEDDLGFAALEYALLPRSAMSTLETIESLMEAGADVSHTDANGWTPLMHASRWAPVEAIRLLLAHGAEATAVSDDGWTAFSIALASSEIDHWIGWVRNDPRMRGLPEEALGVYATPLHSSSVGSGHVQRIEALLRFGRIDVAAEDARRDLHGLRADWDEPLGKHVRELLDNPPAPEDPAAPNE